MINKGIILVGDSYTWGHGLWQYYPNDSYSQEDGIHTEQFTSNPALQEFHLSNRWARIVSTHFKTFERVRKYTAGSDYESLYSLNQFFGENLGQYASYPQDGESPMRYKDISYVIFGTSYIDRCPHIKPFNTDEGIYLEDVNPEMLQDYGFINVKQFLDYHKRYYFNRIKTKLMTLENQGVKTLIWNVTSVYKELFGNDEWMMKRLIPLDYKNDSEFDMEELMGKHKHLILSEDSYFKKYQKRNPPKDGHPSLYAQQVMADNVIKSINKRNSENW
jgi:hypothetical protein|tara:strand:- start:590 stop:1414 length:825 start_codon:yes stop_codon:yes gene_type:complete